MRYLLAILLLIAPRAFGAAGDITSIYVRDDGWSLDVVFSGYIKASTYTFGLDTNNTPTASTKLALTVFSPGYDDTGASNWTSRAIYGTVAVRSNSPNQAVKDERESASDVTNRIALSDFIYAGDSVTANILSGLYSNSAAFSGAVANQSIQTWQPPVVNWTWPGWNQERGSYMRLRMVGFHSSAQQSRPLRCVKFIVTDESGVKVTNTVTRMSVTNDLPDLWPIGEYISDFALSQFTAHNQLRCDFIAFPWHGTNLINTTLDIFTQPTPMPAAITNLCDPNNNYSGFIAVVDPAGSDVNGRATNVIYSSVNSAHYFATIEQAWQFLAASNNCCASPTTHNDAGGGVVYVRAGIVTWLGGTANAGGVPKCWALTTNYPGDTVEFTTASGSTDLTERVKIGGIKIGSGNLFSGIGGLWFDGCVISNVATATFQSSTNVYITYTAVTNIGQGLRSFGGAQNSSMTLLRGVILDGYGGTHRPIVTIGCFKPNTNGANFNIDFDITSQIGPNPGTILYNNVFYGFKNIGEEFINTHIAIPCSNGFAIVQNVLECDVFTGQPWSIGGAGLVPITNGLIWNNTFIGAKVNFAYNDSGSAAVYRWLWSVRNNIFDDYNIKSDTFTTANAARIGNWPCMFGVGYWGNTFMETTNVGTAGTFVNNSTENIGFTGLNTFQPVSANITTTTNFSFFTSRQSYDGNNTPNPGSGNYRTLTPHVGTTVLREALLGFDLDGVPRGGFDPPGAYASASPRKGGAFFGQ